MGTLTVGQEHSSPIDLYYQDRGDGPSVVLLANWPLDSRSGEPQRKPLLNDGHRVVLYDRRELGRQAAQQPG